MCFQKDLRDRIVTEALVREKMDIQGAGIGREKVVLAVISGIALTLSFPKAGISWAAWVALTFLFFAIRNVNVRNSIVLGLVTGMVHFATMVYWLIGTMHIYGYLPLWLSVIIFVPLVFYLALYVAAFAGLVTVLCSSSILLLILAPTLWVCLEYVRTYLLTGFPWGLIGYSQYEQLHLIQIADIFGVYGVSFVIVMVNAVIFCALLCLSKKAWRNREMDSRSVLAAFLGVGVVLSLIFLYGSMRLKSTARMMAGAEKLNIAVVQGNIEQAVKWDLAFRTETIEKYIRLSEQANKIRPDLIVWPETATPFYFKYNIEWTKMVLQAVRSMKTNFIIGSPTVELTDDAKFYYNSAYLVTPDGDIADRNDKVHLVPFGEYVPFKKWLPFVNNIVAQIGDFKTGERGNTLRWAPANIGMLICYEIIFPELAAGMVANGAGVLVNITNDAWFGKTSAPYQHFSKAVFRAVENRRSLVRAANTGISGFIDPTGRVISRSGLFTEAAMTSEIAVIKDHLSFYTRHGNLGVLCCFLVLGASIIVKKLRPLR